MPRKKEVGQRMRKVAKGEEERGGGRSSAVERRDGRPDGVAGRGRMAKWLRAFRTDIVG